VQNTENATLPNANKNLQEEKQSTSDKQPSREIAKKDITIRLERLARPMDEFEAIQVEEYLLKHATLRKGVQDSMSIVDSSANVLQSQLQDLLKIEEGVRRPGDWATQCAASCGKTIAELIRAKTDAMRLLK
jgi:hypothetical protein